MAELMGAEGNWATYDQFNLKMWIPAEFVQTPDDEMPENLKSQGYIDLFGSNDYELAIGVQHSFYDEEVDTVADLADIIDASQYDAPTLTKINNYDVLLLTENQGENLDVCIGGGKGEFLIFHYFHMNADQWSTDRAAISMASIQTQTPPSAQSLNRTIRRSPCSTTSMHRHPGTATARRRCPSDTSTTRRGWPWRATRSSSPPASTARR